MITNRMDSFLCESFLDESGVMRKAHIHYDANRWIRFHIDTLASIKPQGGYVVPMLPVEFHCHGIGGSDFSDFEDLDLATVNENAKQEGILCLLCVSLAHLKLEALVGFMQEYAKASQNGKLTHIVGIALEGPLLASFGGTPEQGMWAPSKEEWEKIASCGELGLQYLVLSPDAELEGSNLANQITSEYPSMKWIVSILLEAGIRVALGHFQKINPIASAHCIQTILQLAKERGCRPFSGMIITDHLFNDMPLKFRHAWRTSRDRLRRSEEIKHLQLNRWCIDNLNEMLGDVPAALMRAAYEGSLTLCLNFDNEHVDLDVCRRVVELVGTDSVIAMTDRTDTNSLARQKLEKKEGSLWYQERGIVAAGSRSIDYQMSNIRSIGLSEASMWKLTSLVPLRVLGISPQYSSDGIPKRCCYVSDTGERYYIESNQL